MAVKGRKIEPESAPEQPAPKPKEPTEPKLPREPKPVPLVLPRVSAAVFVQATNKKPDSAGAFLYAAKARGLGARTIPEWETVWNEVQNQSA